MRLNVARTELLRFYPPASADGDLLVALSPSPDENTNPAAVIAVASAELVKNGNDGNDMIALLQHVLNEREALFGQLAAVVEGIALRLHRNALALAELGRSQSKDEGVPTATRDGDRPASRLTRLDAPAMSVGVVVKRKIPVDAAPNINRDGRRATSKGRPD
jgi:hypothetical protein